MNTRHSVEVANLLIEEPPLLSEKVSGILIKRKKGEGGRLYRGSTQRSILSEEAATLRKGKKKEVLKKKPDDWARTRGKGKGVALCLRS